MGRADSDTDDLIRDRMVDSGTDEDDNGQNGNMEQWENR